jgi:hypothetical protein
MHRKTALCLALAAALFAPALLTPSAEAQESSRSSYRSYRYSKRKASRGKGRTALAQCQKFQQMNSYDPQLIAKWDQYKCDQVLSAQAAAPPASPTQ